MKKNGFTLIELLAVIVILSVLMTIAGLSAIKLNEKVKEKAYDTKINLIEKKAEDYGLTNKYMIKEGKRIDENISHACLFEYDNDKITKVNYNEKEYSSFEGENEYWCTRYTLDELAKIGEIEYDLEDEKYIINNKNNNVINLCYIYLYYRNNRVYSYFDINECNIIKEQELGHEYRRQ